MQIKLHYLQLSALWLDYPAKGHAPSKQSSWWLHQNATGSWSAVAQVDQVQQLADLRVRARLYVNSTAYHPRRPPDFTQERDSMCWYATRTLHFARQTQPDTALHD